MNSPSFSIIIDTREKTPWEFDSSSILNIEYRKLDTGDYSIVGLEDKLCIERKMSATEIAANVHQKRFAAELERMLKYKYRYIIIESNMFKIVNYPLYENIPPKIRKKIRVNGHYLLRCIDRIRVKYGVDVIFADTPEYGMWIATNIMKEVVNIENG